MTAQPATLSRGQGCKLTVMLYFGVALAPSFAPVVPFRPLGGTPLLRKYTCDQRQRSFLWRRLSLLPQVTQGGTVVSVSPLLTPVANVCSVGLGPRTLLKHFILSCRFLKS
jgi:hypothetical protein